MKKSLLSLLALFCALSAVATLRMPAYYGNHMVLQRDVPVVLRGTADPGKRVTALLGDRKATTKTGKDGRWQISLPAFAAGGPYTLQVTAGKEVLSFDDILFGEVWICSGQSNMEFRVRSAADADAEIAQADYPRIRSFNVAQAMNNKPQDDLAGEWQVCSPATVADFSAVGYFFARDLYLRLDVPARVHRLPGRHEDAGRRDVQDMADRGAVLRHGRRNTQQRHQDIPIFAVHQRAQVLPP